VLRSGRVLSRAGVRVVAALSLVLLFVGAPNAQAAPDIKQKLSAASDDLAQASKAVNAAMAALDRARTQLPAAQAALAAALNAKVTAQRAAAAAAVAESRATAAVLDAQRRLATAKQRIVDSNLEIGSLSRAVYMAGPYNELAAILSAATPSDFADQLEAIRSVSRSQNKTLADLEAAKADVALATIQAQQAKDQATAAAALATASLAKASSAASRALAAKAHVDALVRARAQGLAIAAKEKARVKKQYLALKAEQIRLAALERRSSGASGFTGTPSGSLIWPIPGASIVGGVGWRVHPVYGYKSCHTGEDIRGTFGTPILAAADGKVILVASGGAYGLHTVISHGGGISTMSAHQSATAVHVGEIVRQGQVIGYVGASGWVTGPHLHWEVHVNGVPYDPLGWFGFPRVPVPCWTG
jgi:murein DD-endopeptidase MepM/ murein hydrolase activator NlpD